MTLTAMRPEAGFGNGPGDIAPEALPGFLVDLGLEGGLERLVGITGSAGEVGVADEEALAVVVGVNEPARDVVRAVAPDFASLRVEHVHTVEPHLDAGRRR